MSSITSSPRKHTSRLAGKLVFVLGGTSGIGYGVAEAAIEYGASVYITGSNYERLEKAVSSLKTYYQSILQPEQTIAGVLIDLFPEDASNLEPAIRGVFETVTGGKQRTVDHIANLAGTAPSPAGLADVTADFLQHKGTARVTQAVLVAKIAHVGGYLTPGSASSYTTVSGLLGVKPRAGMWVPALYGKDGLAQGLALEMKPTRVNTVAPGLTRTPMVDGLFSEAQVQGMAKQSLAGEVGTVEDQAAIYLACMLSYQLTGQLILVDGGSILV